MCDVPTVTEGFCYLFVSAYVHECFYINVHVKKNESNSTRSSEGSYTYILSAWHTSFTAHTVNANYKYCMFVCIH